MNINALLLLLVSAWSFVTAMLLLDVVHNAYMMMKLMLHCWPNPKLHVNPEFMHMFDCCCCCSVLKTLRLISRNSWLCCFAVYDVVTRRVLLLPCCVFDSIQKLFVWWWMRMNECCCHDESCYFPRKIQLHRCMCIGCCFCSYCMISPFLAMLLMHLVRFFWLGNVDCCMPWLLKP